jgi:hypothetical protein
MRACPLIHGQALPCTLMSCMSPWQTILRSTVLCMLCTRNFEEHEAMHALQCSLVDMGMWVLSYGLLGVRAATHDDHSC